MRVAFQGQFALQFAHRQASLCAGVMGFVRILRGPARFFAAVQGTLGAGPLNRRWGGRFGGLLGSQTGALERKFWGDPAPMKPEGEADGGPPLLKLRRTGVVQVMSGEAPR